MFGSTMEYTTRNEKGEYEVARGISANVFKCILVRFCLMHAAYVLKATYYTKMPADAQHNSCSWCK